MNTIESKKQLVINRVKSFFPGVEVKFFLGKDGNSFVTGQCIYFNQEIVTRLPEPLLMALVDHEIAHHKYHHVYVNRIMMLIWSGMVVLPWCFVDLSHYVYLSMFSIGMFVIIARIYGAIIRKQEYIADKFSIRYNGRENVVKMLITVSNTDLFRSSYSHPSIKSRIDYINGSQV